MFCVSDRLHHHHRLQPPATVFIPASYNDQQAFATMMMSVLPSGQTLMTNLQPASVPPLPPLSMTPLCEFQQGTPPTPSRPTHDGWSPAKLKTTRKQQIRRTAVKCRDDTAGRVTSFRIADILDWCEGSSGRRVHRRTPPAVETTELEMRPSVGKTSIVRPWDERRSSSVSSTSSPSEVEERNVDDDEAAEIDVDDACWSLTGTTSSDTTSDSDVCPLGALLRMTNQTNFDECANRLQECFTDGWYPWMLAIV